jgi:hypothetical protein
MSLCCATQPTRCAQMHANLCITNANMRKQAWCGRSARPLRGSCAKRAQPDTAGTGCLAVRTISHKTGIAWPLSLAWCMVLALLCQNAVVSLMLVSFSTGVTVLWLGDCADTARNCAGGCAGTARGLRGTARTCADLVGLGLICELIPRLVPGLLRGAVLVTCVLRYSLLLVVSCILAHLCRVGLMLLLVVSGLAVQYVVLPSRAQHLA